MYKTYKNQYKTYKTKPFTCMQMCFKVPYKLINRPGGGIDTDFDRESVFAYERPSKQSMDRKNNYSDRLVTRKWSNHIGFIG